MGLANIFHPKVEIISRTWNWTMATRSSISRNIETYYYVKFRCIMK